MAIGPLSGSALSLFKSSTGNALMQNILLARDNAFGKKDGGGSEGALNILDKLKSASNEESAERKEAARQKIERIKAQIAALRMMAAGDPKAAARQAARLARELATAGREYANAGGGADAAAASAGAAASGAAAGAAGSANAEKTAAAAEAQGAAPAEASAQTATVTQAAKETADNIAKGDADADADAAAPQGEESVATTGQTIREAVAEKINAAQKVITGGKADSEFAQELRRLMSDLRGILENAKQRMRDDNESDHNIDVQEAEKALREAGEAATTIMSGGMAAMVMNVDITV